MKFKLQGFDYDTAYLIDGNTLLSTSNRIVMTGRGTHIIDN